MRKHSLLFMIVVVATLLASCRRAEDFVKDGNRQYLKGDMVGALASYNEAIARKPDLAEAFLGRGNIESDRGDAAAAIKDYDRAIALDASLGASYCNRGNLKHGQGDLVGAIADYDKAIEIDANDETAIMNRGTAAAHTGDFSRAVADLTKAIALKPRDADAYYNRGNVRQAAGDLEGALKDYDEAIALSPAFGDAYYARGFLRADQLALEDALRDFNKYLEFNRENSYAHFQLWLVQMRMAQNSAAEEQLRDYLKIRTDNTNGWPVIIGRFFLGEVSEASLLKAAESSDKRTQDEQLCDAYYYAGFKYLLDGKMDSARDCFEKCVATKAYRLAEWRSAATQLRRLKVGEREYWHSRLEIGRIGTRGA